jgi:hypothetical protein
MTGQSRATTPPCPSCDSTDPQKRWGHEIPGVYDGILFWSCASCGHVWPRDFGVAVGLTRKSEEYVDLMRQERNVDG